MGVDVLGKAKQKYHPKYSPKTISLYEYWAWVERVVDGDTVDFVVSLGFELEIRARVRLLGVDLPEMCSIPKAYEEYELGIGEFTCQS